jgi:hypothetical protein
MIIYKYTEDGQRLYTCLRCFDLGWTYPLKDDGKPDYSKAERCPCKVKIEPKQGDLFEHPEKPSKRRSS